MDSRRKVGVLTLYHNNTNFGATLQAYALQKKIKEQGFNACVVDFIPERLSFDKRILRLFLNPSRLPGVVYRRLEIVKSDKKTPTEIEWDRLWKRRQKTWQNFCCKNIDVTAPVPERDLPQYLDRYGILLVGSDQVWNPAYCSKAHFLPFKKKGRKKIAYAASISRPSLTEKEKRIFKKWLPDFDYITVRENEGKRLLESFLDVKVDVVLDPTLLLSADDWNKVAETWVNENQVSYRKADTQHCDNRSNYVLFAALGTDPAHRNFAARIADRMGLRLIILSTTLAEMTANKELEGYELVDVSPGQYLSLVRDASLVITDSFHCMAFSINFHRPFWVLKRDPDGQVYNMNSRLYTLLGALGLEDQLIDPDDADRVQPRDDLYIGVDRKLDSLRQRSEKILSQMLNNENGEELM